MKLAGGVANILVLRALAGLETRNTCSHAPLVVLSYFVVFLSPQAPVETIIAVQFLKSSILDRAAESVTHVPEKSQICAGCSTKLKTQQDVTKKRRKRTAFLRTKRQLPT